MINLANKTFDDSSEPAIEESWVWRGRAKAMLGDIDGAIEDFETALEWHPGWWVARSELEASASRHRCAFQSNFLIEILKGSFRL